MRGEEVWRARQNTLDSTIQLPDYNWDKQCAYTMYPVALGSTHACMYVHMYTVHIDKTILCMPDPSDPCPNYSREAG